MDDDRDNFIDLEDSSNEIVDDDVEELGEGRRVGDDAESSEGDMDEEDGHGEDAGVDLNEMSDEEPERDDAAVVFFGAPRQQAAAARSAEGDAEDDGRPKPLHTVATHPSNPSCSPPLARATRCTCAAFRAARRAGSLSSLLPPLRTS